MALERPLFTQRQGPTTACGYLFAVPALQSAWIARSSMVLSPVLDTGDFGRWYIFLDYFKTKAGHTFTDDLEYTPEYSAFTVSHWCAWFVFGPVTLFGITLR